MQFVSIPFIAGQWSLRPFGLTSPEAEWASQSPSLRGSGRFEARAEAEAKARKDVSIPFIAGQWSLLETLWGETRSSTGLNPLHCGAVVASAGELSRGAGGAASQSPSLRGSGRFVIFFRVIGELISLSQSPSLRGSGRFAEARARAAERRAGLNPLHCGAVVASRRQRCSRSHCRKVSIPFIAGQWSLQAAEREAETALTFASQSPSLRGSGRFRQYYFQVRRCCFCLNPLHCGAVVASDPDRSRRLEQQLVSIPFIAGQWSLRPSKGAGACET